MDIFWRLILAHLIADFTLQTDRINAWKRRSMRGVFVHSALHPLVSALLVGPALGRVWIRLGPVDLSGWHCLLVIFALHFLEDQWRVFAIRIAHAPDSTLHFLWDQFVHCAVLFLLFPVAALWRGDWAPEPWVAWGIFFVVVTHFSAILIYFLEKDLWKKPFPNFDEKYLAMAERLVLAIFLVLPGPWSPLLAVLWFAFLWWLRRSRRLDFSGFALWFGAAVSVLSAAAVRLLY